MRIENRPTAHPSVRWWAISFGVLVQVVDFPLCGQRALRYETLCFYSTCEADGMYVQLRSGRRSLVFRSFSVVWSGITARDASGFICFTLSSGRRTHWTTIFVKQGRLPSLRNGLGEHRLSYSRVAGAFFLIIVAQEHARASRTQQQGF